VPGATKYSSFKARGRSSSSEMLAIMSYLILSAVLLNWARISSIVLCRRMISLARGLLSVLSASSILSRSTDSDLISLTKRRKCFLKTL